MIKVIVFGTFDRLHPGHRYVLDSASKRGELHIVVARDSTVEQIKGYLPQQTETERLHKLEQEYPSAKTILGDSNNFTAVLEVVKPDLVILGYDQKLPPGVSERDFICPVERLNAYHPDKYKSSTKRSKQV